MTTVTSGIRHVCDDAFPELPMKNCRAMLWMRMWSSGITHSLPKLAASFRASTSYTTQEEDEQSLSLELADSKDNWLGAIPVFYHHVNKYSSGSTNRPCCSFSPCQTEVSGSWSHTPSSQTEDCWSGSWSHWCLEDRKKKLNVCASCFHTNTIN